MGQTTPIFHSAHHASGNRQCALPVKIPSPVCLANCIRQHTQVMRTLFSTSLPLYTDQCVAMVRMQVASSIVGSSLDPIDRKASHSASLYLDTPTNNGPQSCSRCLGAAPQFCYLLVGSLQLFLQLFIPCRKTIQLPHESPTNLLSSTSPLLHLSPMLLRCLCTCSRWVILYMADAWCSTTKDSNA